MALGRRGLCPDARQATRALREPERGPRVLFFSGGSALRRTSRALKAYTHNSIHLVTPFDSGGSSAHLRAAFAMLSVGDVRNRVVALADETVPGSPAVRRFLSHRLARDAAPAALRASLDALIAGHDPLAAELPDPLRRLASAHLEVVRAQAPSSFDLRGASVGNLFLAGGYLSAGRDLTPVLTSLTRLLAVRGDVRPVVTDDLHLCAALADGGVVVGQHRITGNGAPPPSARIDELRLVRSLDDVRPAEAVAAEDVTSRIASADLICFPTGSFFTSVVANLLPRGIGAAIARAPCPKVFVPNAGDDPEMRGMNVADAVEHLLRVLRADAGDVDPERLVDAVLLHTDEERYARPVDAERIERSGVPIVRLPLLEADAPRCDPRKLAEALLSLTSPAAALV